MGKDCHQLVILGNNVTALAVARDARLNRLRPVLFDHRPGFAFKSALADKAVCRDTAPAAVLDRIDRIADKAGSGIIAAGDDWLRFMIAHRPWFQQRFDYVLHAENGVLDACLNKRAFLIWCRQNGFDCPRFYDLPKHEDDTASDCARIQFPVLLRPADLSPEAQQRLNLPKAMHIEDPVQLRHWLDRFRQAGVDFTMTESLLHSRLIQYSVAVARNGMQMVSFVAKKVRPYPEACSVGTYVVLAPDAKIEGVARNLAEQIGFYGIGELEILHSPDTGRSYVIEFNVRPWLQYALAVASNHSMLKFLLRNDEYVFDSEIKTGKNWLWLHNDLYVVFSKSEGCIRQGRISLGEYFRSVMRANVSPLFSWSDPSPGLFSAKELVTMLLRSRFNHNEE